MSLAGMFKFGTVTFCKKHTGGQVNACYTALSLNCPTAKRPAIVTKIRRRSLEQKVTCAVARITARPCSFALKDLFIHTGL